MDTTPPSLLQRLRQPGDQEAWSRFVELYTPLIWSWARRTGMQEVDAADLVQEVFALLIEKMPQFVYQQHRSFRAWLKTVTLNKWRESCRRQAAMPRTAALSSGDLAGKEESDAFWETEYRQQVLDRALQLIEHDFQPATWKASLQVIAGRPAAEVSRELALTIGAVRSGKCRVLARLRQELAGLLE
jgi:RNA polymerase sigma-70 factor (ECF subfamily)